MKKLQKTAAFLLILSALACFPACKEEETPPAYLTGGEIAVSGGLITGTMNEEGDVAVYKGVPYAAAPVGELRFQAPQDAAWEGVKDCSLWGANAMQGNATTFDYWTEEFIQDTDPSHYQNGTVYSEDCLTLNIWSSTSVTKDKPVLFYIHGGGYNSGGASCPVYDGEAIAKRDVVFVSVQYRVGVFGYLATEALVAEGEESGAGNYGLLDQIKALEWVQENIARFGGDKNNVTIMGQSAGAGSVNALLVSPLAQNLFSAAISASHNSIDRDWPTLSQRMNSAPAALKSKTAAQLREMDVNTLKSYSISNNGPVMDNYVLHDSFREAILNGTMADVPLMSGMVSEDHLIHGVYTSGKVSVVDSLMTLQNNIVTAKIKNGYFSDTYVYLFNRNVPQDTKKTANAYGAKHSYDLAYFFGNFAESRPWTDTDYTLGDIMTGYLVNFCKYQDPNGESLPSWGTSLGDYSYMRLDEACSIEQVPEANYTAINNHYKLKLEA